jgi:hypothetical protein
MQRGSLKNGDELEKSGFPLLFVSRLLVAWEIKDREDGKFFLLPVPIHKVKILDSIQCIKHISGGSESCSKLVVSYINYILELDLATRMVPILTLIQYEDKEAGSSHFLILYQTRQG